MECKVVKISALLFINSVPLLSISRNQSHWIWPIKAGILTGEKQVPEIAEAS